MVYTVRIQTVNMKKIKMHSCRIRVYRVVLSIYFYGTEMHQEIENRKVIKYKTLYALKYIYIVIYHCQVHNAEFNINIFRIR